MSATTTPNDSPISAPIQPLHNPAQAAHAVVPRAPLGNVVSQPAGMGAEALLQKKMGKSLCRDKTMTPAPGLHPGHHSHLQDGWLIDSLAHRIIWIPPWLRDDFCLPWNSLVLGPAGVVKLDLAYFVHGTEWEKCVDSSSNAAR
ncbi:hypothetical protein B0H14DRAFT_2442530 [Mycena olivaceomarginata]|nr:hypothetical protein B0H14DRAFT_2442530 [Mycena olivaceomarginata]